MSVVIKFGGSNLDSPENIRRAAEMVGNYSGRGVVVVVSAMKGETERLSNIYMECTDSPDDRELDAILSAGEMTSARLFASALRSRGIDAQEVVPNGENWLIATDSSFGDAKPLRSSLGRAQGVLGPYLERGVVPVVCGFIGVDNDGRITTLGRGGSDCTATLISNAIGAEELILVKDTGGIMSADPGVVKSARQIGDMSLKELSSLTSGGSGVVQCNSLKYLNGAVFRVVPLEEGSGTVIRAAEEVSTRGPLHSVSIVGELTPELFVGVGRLFTDVQAVSTSSNSISFFLEGECDLQGIHDSLIDVRGFKAVTSRDTLGLIEIDSPNIIDTPGVISTISQGIADAGISIIEMTTSGAGVSVVVEYGDLEACSEIFNRVLGSVEW